MHPTANHAMYFSQTRYRTRTRARPVHVHDVGARKFRGGQVWSRAGDTVTIRTLAESAFVRDYPVLASLFDGTDAQPTIGDPVILEVTGETPNTFTVIGVQAGRVTYQGSDQAASVGRGEFSPALLNGHVSGVPVYQDEA